MDIWRTASRRREMTMVQLLPILVPLLLVDVLNPALFAMLVFAAGAKRPVANSASILLGHTIAYFAVGILVALGLDRVVERFANPLPVDFVLGGIIGIGLLWTVMRPKERRAAAMNEPRLELTPLRCLALGTIVSFVGAPFALPYLAAVDQVLKADLTVADSLVTLAIYNVAYALPFSLVPVTVALFGNAAKPLLQRMNNVLARAAGVAMPWMLGLLGLALVADSASYFIRGAGLW